MGYFAKISKKAKRKHKNMCPVSIAYLYIINNEKFHYLQRFRIVYSLFCSVLQYDIDFPVLKWIPSVHVTYPHNI